jgi:hypothetical protein
MLLDVSGKHKPVSRDHHALQGPHLYQWRGPSDRNASTKSSFTQYCKTFPPAYSKEDNRYRVFSSTATSEFFGAFQVQYGAWRFDDDDVSTRSDYLIAEGSSVALTLSSKDLRQITQEASSLSVMYTDRYGRDCKKPCWGYNTVPRIAPDEDGVCMDSN